MALDQSVGDGGPAAAHVAAEQLDLLRFAAPVSDKHQQAFGLLRVAGALLAVPVAAIREATPLRTLSPMPSSAAGMLGALTLRGDVIPVLDLRATLGLGGERAAQSMILVLRLEGRRLLGLAADEVCGIATSQADGLAPLEIRSMGDQSLTPQSLVVGERAAAVLNIERLASQPGVLLGIERQIERRARARARDDLPLLMLRVGAAELAVDALRVEASVPRTEIIRNALTGGWRLGVIARRNREIPVICPLAAFGLGPMIDPVAAEIVILRLDDGALLGIAIDQVRDIRRIAAADILPLPPGVDGGGALFSGLVAEKGGGQSILLDVGAVSARTEFTSLAALARDLRSEDNVPAAERGPDRAATRGAHGGDEIQPERRQHLVYVAGAELATPLEEVMEIAVAPETFAAGPSRWPGFLGYWARRGKAMPIFDLAGCIGLYGARGADARILIVDSPAGPMGFMIERLNSIAPAVWRSRPTRPDLTPGDELVKLSDGPKARAVARLDLVRLAREMAGTSG
jgi:purine-binding chemotaxis protein CheW